MKNINFKDIFTNRKFIISMSIVIVLVIVILIFGNKLFNDRILFDYELNSDGNGYTVTGFTNMNIFKIAYFSVGQLFGYLDYDVEIPETYKDLPVTAIGDGAFEYKGATSWKMVSMVIPETVTTIGNKAFKGVNFKNITIPSSVTKIGAGAFDISMSGVSLENVYYLGEIEDWLKIEFGSSNSNPLNNGSKLYINDALVTDVVVPNTVNHILNYAFVNYSYLNSINISKSVKTIGISAFSGCYSLKTVTIPDSVTTIGGDSFRRCTSLISVTIGSSVSSIGGCAFMDCCSLIEVINKSSLDITAGEQTNGDIGDIGNYAKHIITDELYSAIVKMGDYIFYDDGTDIYLVKYFGNDSEITLPEYEGGKKYGIWDNAFQSKEIISVKIPDYVTSIGANAFNGCLSLTKVTIPDSVKSIGYWAFSGCSSLSSVTIPNSVNNIGDWAFASCDKLTIYCAAQSKPSGWDKNWNSSNRPVVWGYKD